MGDLAIKKGESHETVRASRPGELAKFSVGTVDRALNERSGIKKETRDRVLAIARNHGYMPNLPARALSFSGPPFEWAFAFPERLTTFTTSCETA